VKAVDTVGENRDFKDVVVFFDYDVVERTQGYAETGLIFSEIMFFDLIMVVFFINESLLPLSITINCCCTNNFPTTFFFFFSSPSPLALQQSKEAKASPYDKFEGLSVNENDFF